MNVRSLGDYETNSPPPESSSYTGGEKSALSVQNPASASSAFPRAIQLTGDQISPDASRVTLFQNGFTVNQGPFRPLSDPENSRFIAQLKEGYAPKELQKGNKEVDVSLEDRSHETYKEPSSSPSLFSGSGHIMGNLANSEPPPVDLDKAPGVSADPDRPKTTLQIRFHNGRTKTIEMNEEHTVRDLHEYIADVAPLPGGYVLVSGFPPSPIESDIRKTLREAGLVNSLVTQQRSK